MTEKILVSSIIHAPINTVWSKIRDFRPDWHPDVADCHIEDNEVSDRVGCIRNFNLKDGVNIRERLLTLSDLDKTYVYAIESSPMPINNYVAALKLQPITQANETYAIWSAEFNCPAELQSDMQEKIQGVFERGLTQLNVMVSK